MKNLRRQHRRIQKCDWLTKSTTTTIENPSWKLFQVVFFLLIFNLSCRYFVFSRVLLALIHAATPSLTSALPLSPNSWLGRAAGGRGKVWIDKNPKNNRRFHLWCWRGQCYTRWVLCCQLRCELFWKAAPEQAATVRCLRPQPGTFT